jgi:hypothetical protein
MLPAPRKSRAFRLVVSLVIIYLMGATVLYFFQEKFLFHPEPIERNRPHRFDMPFEETDIPFSATDTINLVKFFPDTSVAARGLLIYFHGNQKNITRYAPFAANFTRSGYEVWMPDYPGFGKSTGELTEKKMYRMAEQLYRLAEPRFGASRILVYGRSMGSGTAAYLASVKPVKALVLETPYCSIPELVSDYVPFYPCRLLLRYEFPVRNFLSETDCPVTIFQGTDDWVVRHAHARRLEKSLKAGSRFVSIEGGSHNNLGDYPLYHRILDSVLK